ncbi:MAG TPA: type II toxin-antitoxin system VapC family toxin [Terriglobales bacterium]|jgi:ribonuclease VapC
MVIASSALLAILLQETEAAALAAAIHNDPVRLISAATLLETAMVIEARRWPDRGRELDLLIYRMQAELIAFSPEQAEVAREAFRKFGKGRHPAGLNFGDCIAYALAQTAAQPLLFKGGDFSRTDVMAALNPS